MSDFTALLALIHVAHMRLGSSFAVTIAPSKRGPKKGTCEPQNRNNVVKPSQVFTAKLEKGTREARGGKFYTTPLQTAQFPGDMACSRSPLQIMAQRLLQERQHSPEMNYSPRAVAAGPVPARSARPVHSTLWHYAAAVWDYKHQSCCRRPVTLLCHKPVCPQCLPHRHVPCDSNPPMPAVFTPSRIATAILYRYVHISQNIQLFQRELIETHANKICLVIF